MEIRRFQLIEGQLELLNNGQRIVICVFPGDIPCTISIYPPEGRIRVEELKRL